MSLKQEYMNIPNMSDESKYYFYFKLTHPSYKYVDDNGREIDIRDVMKMDTRHVHIAPRTDEIKQIWDDYTNAYLSLEKGLENAIKVVESGADISADERYELEETIDRYNDIYKDIRHKEEDDHGYLIRDRREFIVWMFRAAYLGSVLKKAAYKKGAAMNISHIAHKSMTKYADILVDFYCPDLDIAPRIFSEKELKDAYAQTGYMMRGEYNKTFVDPKILLDKARQDRIDKHREDYENHRYFFLDEDRMGLYRMILETGLTKEEIWERCGFERNGGNLGTEVEYIYH